MTSSYSDLHTSLELIDLATFGLRKAPLATLQAMFTDPAYRRGHRISALSTTWMMTMQPSRVLPQEQWVSMFRSVGYFDMLHYGSPAPTQPLLLFRGAAAAGARGMSWTPEPLLAARYGPVWKCEVPPAALLARVGAGWQQEYVVDLPSDATVEAVR